MQNLLKQKSNQQGYILVVALIAMLFIGAIFVASTNRSGTEERVAVSQLHAASLESAIYAGMYRVEKASEKAQKEENKTKAKMLCLDVETGINALPKKQEFQAATDQEAGIFWEVSSVEAKCGLEKPEVYFGLVAWQGDKGKPISRIAGNGKILITSIDDGNNGVDEDGIGIASSLKNVLGNNAAKSSGTITATGGTKIIGNTTGNKIKVNGGAEVVAGNLAYQDLDIPDWYKWKDEDDFWYNLAEKMLLDEEIKIDPLGLEKAMNESFYTDQDDKKIPLKNLPKASVRDAFANLEHGQKKEMGQHPFQQAKISPEKFEVYNDDWRVEDHQEVDIPIYSPVSFLGEDVSLRVFDNFKINSGGSDPSLKVSGGRVVIFIDGDVEMNGGASMQIDSDSSLTLIVTGEFKLTGGFEFLNKNAVNDKGEPLFTLLSTYTGKKEAVKIAGGTKLYGVVYALSDLKLGGSGSIVGQAFGANINASGGTAIDYQPAFGGGGNTDGNGGTSGGGGESEFTPKLDSDFKINY